MADELTLTRVDYAQVGTTGRGTLKLVPGAHVNELQRVVVGSHNGVLMCFSRKKNDTSVVFKTLPSTKIDCMALGGALGTVQDKVFTCSANTIKGYSKKGKQFFTFTTNMTENVTIIYIYGVDMFLCGTNTFNHYHDCQETHYYLCPDRINDVLCLPITEGSWVGRGITPVLACDDKTIKVLEGSTLSYQVECSGVPSVLMLHQNTGGPEGQLVVFGTKDGQIGLVDLALKSGFLKWEISSSNGSAAVTALHCHDMTKTGYPELLVGKDDGIIEIYTVDDNDKIQLKQTYHCDESITGLQGGQVGSAAFNEIVVATYTGWVFGLTTEPKQKELDPNVQFTLNPEMEVKVQQMKGELDELQNKVTEERERYHQQAMEDNASGLSAVPIFAVNDKFNLSKEEAAYTLSIELIVPIDYVMLQCDVPIDLLDVEKNSAVVSLTQCEPNSGNALLATYRCQANTTRLETKVRSIEGQHGTLQAYISPKTQPKVCQVRQYAIKPLSLHQRTHSYDASRPQNTLRITGGFSMAEAHSWAHFCLPELPDKVPDSQAIFYFSSTFTNTQLQTTYSKGTIMFKSDNISTIAILRDVLSKEATRKKMKVDISCDVNDESVTHTLQLLHPKLEYQLNLSKKVHLAEALKELQTQDEDTSYISFLLMGLIRPTSTF